MYFFSKSFLMEHIVLTVSTEVSAVQVYTFKINKLDLQVCPTFCGICGKLKQPLQNVRFSINKYKTKTEQTRD